MTIFRRNPIAGALLVKLERASATLSTAERTNFKIGEARSAHAQAKANLDSFLEVSRTLTDEEHTYCARAALDVRDFARLKWTVSSATLREELRRETPIGLAKLAAQSARSGVGADEIAKLVAGVHEAKLEIGKWSRWAASGPEHERALCRTGIAAGRRKLAAARAALKAADPTNPATLPDPGEPLPADSRKQAAAIVALGKTLAAIASAAPRVPASLVRALMDGAKAIAGFSGEDLAGSRLGGFVDELVAAVDGADRKRIGDAIAAIADATGAPVDEQAMRAVANATTSLAIATGPTRSIEFTKGKLENRGRTR